MTIRYIAIAVVMSMTLVAAQGFAQQPTRLLRPPPPGGLEPVFESTEKSAFSSTADWGKHLGSDTGAVSDGSGLGGGSLGTDGNMATVKKGFFDASQVATPLRASPCRLKPPVLLPPPSPLSVSSACVLACVSAARHLGR